MRGEETSEPVAVDSGASGARIARRFHVSGTVQGVGFRYATQDAAAECGVLGWARNLFDGRVEVWAEGAPEAVAALADWLQHGPRSARVTGVEGTDEDPRGLEDFTIR